MITVVLLIAALVCFLIGAVGVAIGRVNMVSLGLALYIVAQLIGTLHLS